MTTFSQAELNRMCRPPQQRLRDALREGGPTAVQAVYRLMENLIRDITELYAQWSAVTVGWLIDRHGYDAAARAFPVHELWPADDVPHLTGAAAAMARDVLRGPDSATAAGFASVAATEDEDAILQCWREIHAATYTAETLRRDTVTALLTLVNDTYGTDGLEDCLRYATEVIWVSRMDADLARPAEVRLRSWAEKMSVGHKGGWPAATRAPAAASRVA